MVSKLWHLNGCNKHIETIPLMYTFRPSREHTSVMSTLMYQLARAIYDGCLGRNIHDLCREKTLSCAQPETSLRGGIPAENLLNTPWLKLHSCEAIWQVVSAHRYSTLAILREKGAVLAPSWCFFSILILRSKYLPPRLVIHGVIMVHICIYEWAYCLFHIHDIIASCSRVYI